MPLARGAFSSLYFERLLMFTIWTTVNGQWHEMAYAPRERWRAESLLRYYQETWPHRDYQLAPAGFSPALAWAG